jgi:maleylacetate reductase
MSLYEGEFSFTTTERVVYGRPSAEVVAKEAERRGAHRVFLIVSDHLRRQTQEITQIERALDTRHAGTHSGVPPHVPRSAALEAANQVRASEADLLIAVGGGSVIDLTKLVPLILANDVRTVEDFERIRMRVRPGGGFAFPTLTPPALRIINVGTTLSGADFSAMAGAMEEGTGEKHPYAHPLCAAVTIVLDPAITRHTPEWLWLSTGVRAIDHCAESLASLRSNAVSDSDAAAGLRLLLSGLREVRRDPNDLAARLKCQMGAWKSVAPANAGVPVGLSHAIGHVLGGTCNVPHGYTSCVMLPQVMAWNSSINSDRQALISTCFDEPNVAAAELLDQFIRELGLPRTLREVGVTKADLPVIAERTLDDLFGRTNPRPVQSVDDVLAVLYAAF